MTIVIIALVLITAFVVKDVKDHRAQVRAAERAANMRNHPAGKGRV